MTAPLEFMFDGGSSVLNLVQGPATVYIAAYGAVEPAASAVASAPNPAVWTDIGATTDGVSISIQQEYKEMDVDQVADIPGRRLTKRDLTVKTNMAEPTLANLVYCLNDGTTASGTGYSSYDPAYTDSSTQPTYRALLLHGWAPGDGSNSQSKRRMVILRKALSSDNVEFAYKKDEQTVFTVTWSIHYVSNSIAPFRIVDQA